MTAHDIDAIRFQQSELPKLVAAECVEAFLLGAFFKGRSFVVTRTVAAALDSTHTRYPVAAKLDDSREAKEEDIGRSPAAIWKLPEVCTSLVVASNENSGNRSLFSTTINSGRRITCSTDGSLSSDDTFLGTPSSRGRLHFEQLGNHRNK